MWTWQAISENSSLAAALSNLLVSGISVKAKAISAAKVVSIVKPIHFQLQLTLYGEGGKKDLKNSSWCTEEGT